MLRLICLRKDINLHNNIESNYTTIYKTIVVIDLDPLFMGVISKGQSLKNIQISVKYADQK